ncbi:hypothetical protein B0H16DRAFT_1704473 [Mycena metata]|uniref:Uncharacterized protein n=1 Tax=Mycena metata TaxID=1033252 RepID=A0AAD7M8T5_9AGAR|nr:hypothetical protein B0H16DRAFT_1704473 [Mycena metata]
MIVDPTTGEKKELIVYRYKTPKSSRARALALLLTPPASPFPSRPRNSLLPPPYPSISHLHLALAVLSARAGSGYLGRERSEGMQSFVVVVSGWRGCSRGRFATQPIHPPRRGPFYFGAPMPSAIRPTHHTSLPHVSLPNMSIYRGECGKGPNEHAGEILRRGVVLRHMRWGRPDSHVDGQQDRRRFHRTIHISSHLASTRPASGSSSSSCASAPALLTGATCRLSRGRAGWEWCEGIRWGRRGYRRAMGWGCRAGTCLDGIGARPLVMVQQGARGYRDGLPCGAAVCLRRDIYAAEDATPTYDHAAPRTCAFVDALSTSSQISDGIFRHAHPIERCSSSSDLALLCLFPDLAVLRWTCVVRRRPRWCKAQAWCPHPSTSSLLLEGHLHGGVPLPRRVDVDARACSGSLRGGDGGAKARVRSPHLHAQRKTTENECTSDTCPPVSGLPPSLSRGAAGMGSSEVEGPRTYSLATKFPNWEPGRAVLPDSDSMRCGYGYSGNGPYTASLAAVRRYLQPQFKMRSHKHDEHLRVRAPPALLPVYLRASTSPPARPPSRILFSTFSPTLTVMTATSRRGRGIACTSCVSMSVSQRAGIGWGGVCARERITIGEGYAVTLGIGQRTGRTETGGRRFLAWQKTRPLLEKFRSNIQPRETSMNLQPRIENLMRLKKLGETRLHAGKSCVRNLLANVIYAAVNRLAVGPFVNEMGPWEYHGIMIERVCLVFRSVTRLVSVYNQGKIITYPRLSGSGWTG